MGGRAWERICRPIFTTFNFNLRRRPLLVLSRKKDEVIVIGDDIKIMIIEVRGDKVRIGIDSPRDVTVHREEIYEAIKQDATQDL